VAAGSWGCNGPTAAVQWLARRAIYVILPSGHVMATPVSPLKSPASSRRQALFGGAAALVLVVLAVVVLGGHSRAPAVSGPAARSGSAGSRPLAAVKTASVADRRAVSGMAPDPEEAQSFPLPANAAPHAKAISPAQAALLTTVSPGAPSDAQIEAQLKQMEGAIKAESQGSKPGTISAAGTVTPPAYGPATIAAVISGANAIADFPYVYGGGHASFVDNAYDCSGSVSYALAAGGLLSSPETSGDLEHWGVPGPGKYITVYANAGHTFMYIDGLRYDTVGRSGVFGTRWQVGTGGESGNFVVRHYPGL
jgi:cell wall-associated NlpC family hydrolase